MQKLLLPALCFLQSRRKSSGIFAGKQGYITLRDLFRWAERYRQTPIEDLSSKFYDWDQHIAEDGLLPYI